MANRDFLVYLAGPISGLTYDDGQDWREYAAANLPQEIRAISPLRAKRDLLKDVGKIQDAYENNPFTSTTGITARDKFDCMRADAVLFNMAGAKTVSVGTCIEFGWASAKVNPIIITIMEKSGNLHDHPMVRGVTGFRVETLDEGLQALERILMPEGVGTPRINRNYEPANSKLTITSAEDVQAVHSAVQRSLAAPRTGQSLR
jgi:nucleoside 2-deoxyribosyltransferase